MLHNSHKISVVYSFILKKTKKQQSHGYDQVQDQYVKKVEKLESIFSSNLINDKQNNKSKGNSLPDGLMIFKILLKTSITILRKVKRYKQGKNRI